MYVCLEFLFFRLVQIIAPFVSSQRTHYSPCLYLPILKYKYLNCISR